MTLNSIEVSHYVQESEYSKHSPVGIDLSIKAISKINSHPKDNPTNINGITIDKTVIVPETYEELEFPEDDYLVLEPGVYALTFNEGLKQPISQDLHGFISHRSSLNRIGGLIKSSPFEPGFQVNELGATMFLFNKIYIEKNARIAQFQLLKNSTPEIDYVSQWQGENDVKSSKDVK